MRRARTFARLMAMDMTVTVAYRGEFVLMQIETLVTPLISLLVWQAVLASGADLPVGGSYLTTYFVMVSAVTMLTASWTSFYLANSIRLGELAKWLLRPTSTHWIGLANNVGEKVVKVFLLGPMLVVVGLVVHEQLALPADPVRWVAFTVSVALATCIAFASDVLVGSLAFWFDAVHGFDRARTLVVSVLSGSLVPLVLMPEWARGALAVQPFRYTVSYPLELLLDRGTPDLSGLGLQALWALVFAGAAVLVWRRGLRRYAAAGA